MKRTTILLVAASVALGGCATSLFTGLPAATSNVNFDGQHPDHWQAEYSENATHLMVDGADHHPGGAARAGRLAMRRAGFEIISDVTNGTDGRVIAKSPLPPLDPRATAGVYFREAPGGFQVKAFVANEPDPLLARKAAATIMDEMEAHWQFWAGNDEALAR
ncbi:hypothetical protein [Salipiger mucosus]|uniref:Lipoprotein n=1 Tax=Salipiger mucosus DSM 16094 TaxID=1123237 RepID=S9RS18_9RHOB|nr:hypothetical protein [Salipiger mucosus]EPX76769.1 hypothetical protein Salmuc_04655 [Salipiger mucosus DSM 16094]